MFAFDRTIVKVISGLNAKAGTHFCLQLKLSALFDIVSKSPPLLLFFQSFMLAIRLCLLCIIRFLFLAFCFLLSSRQSHLLLILITYWLLFSKFIHSAQVALEFQIHIFFVLNISS